MSSRAIQPREPRYFLLGRMRAIERAAHRAMLQAIQEAGYPYIGTPHIALMAHMTPEGLRITEFADLMQVTKSAASQLVTWLERHGLVERVPDPADRRATLVRATPLLTLVSEPHGTATLKSRTNGKERSVPKTSPSSPRCSANWIHCVRKGGDRLECETLSNSA
jgi:hypothetical protein